jgi:hypothetical protein
MPTEQPALSFRRVLTPKEPLARRDKREAQREKRRAEKKPNRSSRHVKRQMIQESLQWKKDIEGYALEIRRLQCLKRLGRSCFASEFRKVLHGRMLHGPKAGRCVSAGKIQDTLPADHDLWEYRGGLPHLALAKDQKTLQSEPTTETIRFCPTAL